MIDRPRRAGAPHGRTAARVGPGADSGGVRGRAGARDRRGPALARGRQPARGPRRRRTRGAWERRARARRRDHHGRRRRRWPRRRAGRARRTHHVDRGRGRADPAQRQPSAGGQPRRDHPDAGRGGRRRFGKLYCQRRRRRALRAAPLRAGRRACGQRPQNCCSRDGQQHLYAFDADAAARPPPLWQANFNLDGAVPFTNQDASPRARAAACTRRLGEPRHHGHAGGRRAGRDGLLRDPHEGGQQHVQRLHALALADGTERPGSPATISAVVDGTGWGAVGGKVAFLPGTAEPARGTAAARGGDVLHRLVLPLRRLPVPRLAHGLRRPHAAQSGAERHAQRDGGGIWMSGPGPGRRRRRRIFSSSATATSRRPRAAGGRGGQAPPAAGAFTIEDYFTPSYWAALNAGDRDLGSGGALLMPGTKYLAWEARTGKCCCSTARTSARWSRTIRRSPSGSRCHRAAAPARRAGLLAQRRGRLRLRHGREGLPQAVQARGRPPHAVPPEQVAGPAGRRGHARRDPLITANGTRDGILWVNINAAGDANHASCPACCARSTPPTSPPSCGTAIRWRRGTRFGSFAKYNPPTVYNGRAYVATSPSTTASTARCPETAGPAARLRGRARKAREGADSGAAGATIGPTSARSGRLHGGTLRVGRAPPLKHRRVS